MIGDKIFGGIETNDWKGVSGIVGKKQHSIITSVLYQVRFKEKIRGYFLSLNWNETPCLCRKQKLTKYL